jgi:hypothetical protein
MSHASAHFAFSPFTPRDERTAGAEQSYFTPPSGNSAPTSNAISHATSNRNSAAAPASYIHPIATATSASSYPSTTDASVPLSRRLSDLPPLPSSEPPSRTHSLQGFFDPNSSPTKRRARHHQRGSSSSFTASLLELEHQSEADPNSPVKSRQSSLASLGLQQQHHLLNAPSESEESEVEEDKDDQDEDKSGVKVHRVVLATTGSARTFGRSGASTPAWGRRQSFMSGMTTGDEGFFTPESSAIALPVSGEEGGASASSSNSESESWEDVEEGSEGGDEEKEEDATKELPGGWGFMGSPWDLKKKRQLAGSNQVGFHASPTVC